MKIMVMSCHTPSLLWFRMEMMHDFMKQGCEVVALGNEEASLWKDKFDAEGIKYRQIRCSRNGTNPFADIKTYKDIARAVKEEQPDKIFTYQAKTVIYGCLAAKNVETYALIAGLGSVFMGNSPIKKILEIEYRLALKKAKHVFFQNTDDMSYFIDNKLVDEKNCSIINGSGVDCEKFSPTKLPEKPAFLMISRLIKDKGVMEYLDAARLVKKDYPETRFMLVGPFDTNPSAVTEEELKAYINDGTVEYFGEQDDVRPYISDCSVYCLPSYHEGTPKTVLEAMAMGRAIITTDAPGCRETVVDGDNGYLVQVKNISEIAQKMEKLIQNLVTVKTMGIKSRTIAENKFEIHIVNNYIMSVMEIN